ncbi:MAG: DUF1376 domain-containing protein [Bryobacteraceae bacterium]|nr:DUF1376 domain-containing protein [Bryobacteraceae bacterium]
MKRRQSGGDFTRKPSFFNVNAGELLGVTLLGFSLAEVGAWLRLHGYAWLQNARLPADDSELARILGVTADTWASMKSRVLRGWKRQRNQLVNPKLDLEYNTALGRIEDAVKAGREGGRIAANNRRGISNFDSDPTSNPISDPTSEPVPKTKRRTDGRTDRQKEEKRDDKTDPAQPHGDSVEIGGPEASGLSSSPVLILPATSRPSGRSSPSGFIKAGGLIVRPDVTERIRRAMHSGRQIATRREWEPPDDAIVAKVIGEAPDAGAAAIEAVILKACDGHKEIDSYGWFLGVVRNKLGASVEVERGGRR